MEQRSPSDTAKGVAFLRAVHQIIDAKPPILDDPVVARLLDQTALVKAREHPERFESTQGRHLRAHVVLRSRFAEECLANATRGGTGQFVILGAGFDTFAFRQPEWARPLRIFEVDQHATQNDKRERLTAAGCLRCFAEHLHLPSARQLSASRGSPI